MGINPFPSHEGTLGESVDASPLTVGIDLKGHSLFSEGSFRVMPGVPRDDEGDNIAISRS
ncbi:MAG TPA: hypothetical protein VIK52_04295 [Opitutaceae bacterium]